MGCRVSYLLLCYQQERFVREAVRSALAQDMEGLEVIVSDDCSTDGTYAILAEECARYSGANSLVLRRTESNLGVNRHFNELVGIARGQLIVVAGGDDVARCDKASRIYRQWRDGHSLVFGCAPDVIDEDGRIVGRFYSSGVPKDFSCTSIVARRNAEIFISAFDRVIFERFGPLDDEAVEDQVIPFRAALLRKDGVAVIEEPLVHYRAHSESVVTKLRFSSTSSSLDVVRNKIRSHASLFGCWLDDLKKVNEAGESCYAKVGQAIRQEIDFFRLANDILECNRLMGRLELFGRWVWPGKGKLSRIPVVFSFAISPSIMSKLIELHSRYFMYVRRGIRGR